MLWYDNPANYQSIDINYWQKGKGKNSKENKGSIFQILNTHERIKEKYIYRQ